MADGSVTISTELDNKKLEAQLTSVKKKIISLEEQITVKQRQRMPLVEQAKQLGAELDAAKAKLYEMQNGASYVPKQAISAQEAAVKELESAFGAADGAAARYDKSIRDATVQFDLQKEKAGGLVQQINAAESGSCRMAEATERAKQSMDRFKSRLAAVVRSALIFTVITRALGSLRDWLGKVIKSNPEATAAIAKLKGALLTLAQPLVEVIIPAFTKFVSVLTAIVTKIAQMLSSVFGKTLGQSSQAAKALNDETSALDKTGAAAKKASKSMAAFDEINSISDEEGGESQTVASIAPDFSGLGDDQTQEYKSKIDELTAYVSGALLALGAILLFSGANIPLGLGLLLVGAAGLASVIKNNWGAVDGKVKGAVNSVLTILGAAGLAIGAVLAFTGANIPLGIGLMVIGAASLAGAVALNWDAVKQKLQGPVGAVTALISGALLAIGAVLAFTGTLPLGIALMAVGAAGLATVTALNWDAIKQKLQGPVGGVVAIMSAALLALGAVLAFSGASIPLGIGLMAIGAAGLATTAALNWDTIVTAMRGPVGGIVALAGGALLVLGLILALSGAALPLGIGLMIAGGAALGSAVALNWDAILDKLKGAWHSIKAWFDTVLGPGVSKFFDGVWYGIKFGVVAMVNFVIAAINDMIRLALIPLNLLIDGLNLIPGVSISPLSFSIPLLKLPVPALASGAVIPPNREFMAVLGDQKQGTNIETPESLLRKIVREESGTTKELTLRIVSDRGFVRALKLELDQEDQRKGVKLVRGSV